MKNTLAKTEKIENKIFGIRGKSVMLDSDLAALYQVETSNLNKAVKRNIERFPEDFMFQLNKDEAKNLTFQNGISSWGGRRTLPYVFTEQGVAMLSSVLNSERAIAVNIQIMRAFVAMKQYSLKAQNDDRLTTRLGIMEKALLQYMDRNDKRVDEVIIALNTMLEAKEEKEPGKIGFKPN